MKKFAVQVIGLLILTTAALYFYNPTGQNGNVIPLPFTPQKAALKQLEINGQKIKIEIADTKEKRNKGLGGRDALKDDEGMLFIFDDLKKHSFWMKGLSFPLDFIWIRDNTVVDIILNAKPPIAGQKDADLPIYLPKEDVNKVLEVTAGGVERLGIKIGDMITVTDIPK